MTRIVPDDDAGRALAIDVLRAGGVVAIPTDTVYGLAAAMDAPGGIERLFTAKERPSERAIAVLLADLDQVAAIGLLSPSGRALGAALWPGGLTLIVEQHRERPLPISLTGGRDTIGVRVPDHPSPRAIAAILGPLPTTSANVSGEPELATADAIAERLGGRIDLILDGGPARGGRPSTVVDVSVDPPRILREGAIPAADVESHLRDMGR
ncbi:MAG: threonylcarbamoyl-AMP synthase [Chloroflexi bacterium]|nr:threonylcarbamoyl-AMP synthase [Chloroflexota bacterium]